jgi:hypothetical protein
MNGHVLVNTDEGYQTAQVWTSCANPGTGAPAIRPADAL